MSTINMEQLKQIKAGNAKADPERATFKADTLHCKITMPDGTVVLECELRPRGFTAKEDKRTRKVQGGIGWYADVRGEEAGSYKNFPVTAGLRLSLDGVKVAPNQTVDLTDGEE